VIAGDIPKTDAIIDWFFYAWAAYGIGATLYYSVEAHWWRVTSWVEGRRLDRMIRPQEREERP
jgi:hypothetical protein